MIDILYLIKILKLIFAITPLFVDVTRVPPSLTAGVDPLETDCILLPPWDSAVHFDEREAVGERDFASCAVCGRVG